MTYSAEVLADTPLAYWKLDETSGTIAFDSSGNSRNLGHTVNSSGGGVTPVPNQTSLLADGTGKAVSYAPNAASQANNAGWMNNAQATWECRFKPSTAALTGTVGLVGRWGGSLAANHAALCIIGAKLTCLANVGGTSRQANGATTLVAGTTYTGTLTYDGTTLTAWLNGVSDGTVAASGTLNTSGASIVEVGSIANALAFTGVIDEVSFYNTALSAARILTRHTAATAAVVTQNANANLTATAALTATATATTPTVTHTGWGRQIA